MDNNHFGWRGDKNSHQVKALWGSPGIRSTRYILLGPDDGMSSVSYIFTLCLWFCVLPQSHASSGFMGPAISVIYLVALIRAGDVLIIFLSSSL